MEKAQLDFLKSLQLEAYHTDIYLAVTSPTWIFKDNSSLDVFLPDFELDELGAMRDFAAIPTNGSQPFFKDPKVLDRMALPGLTCPISDTLQIADWFKPILGFRYFFAGDLSVSGDATGISLVHFDTFKNNIVLDFSKRIKGERNAPVDYGPIRQLIYNLSDRGFNICGIAFDQFQSNDSINILINKGYNARVVKYAESFAGCNMLHDLIHTGRFIYYDFNDVFIGEAKELQVVNSKRIDHFQTEGFYNSKDCWDSVVNATYICQEDFYEQTREVQKAEKFARITKSLAGGQKYRRSTDSEDISWLI